MQSDLFPTCIPFHSKEGAVQARLKRPEGVAGILVWAYRLMLYTRSPRTREAESKKTSSLSPGLALAAQRLLSPRTKQQNQGKQHRKEPAKKENMERELTELLTL